MVIINLSLKSLGFRPRPGFLAEQRRPLATSWDFRPFSALTSGFLGRHLKTSGLSNYSRNHRTSTIWNIWTIGTWRSWDFLGLAARFGADFYFNLPRLWQFSVSALVLGGWSTGFYDFMGFHGMLWDVKWWCLWDLPIEKNGYFFGIFMW